MKLESACLARDGTFSVLDKRICGFKCAVTTEEEQPDGGFEENPSDDEAGDSGGEGSQGDIGTPPEPNGQAKLLIEDFVEELFLCQVDWEVVSTPATTSCDECTHVVDADAQVVNIDGLTELCGDYARRFTFSIGFVSGDMTESGYSEAWVSAGDTWQVFMVDDCPSEEDCVEVEMQGGDLYMLQWGKVEPIEMSYEWTVDMTVE